MGLEILRVPVRVRTVCKSESELRERVSLIPPLSTAVTGCYNAETRFGTLMIIDVHDATGRPAEAQFKADGGDTELATIPALVSGCVLFQGCVLSQDIPAVGLG